MLDVHSPDKPIRNWRDLATHILVVTLGLLIALSLEGLVGWQNHRRLRHDAEISLRTEIARNATALADVLADLNKKQDALKLDIVVLKSFITSTQPPPDRHIDINFSIRLFDDVSWKTAQSTGALAYMPYDLAKEYASIYATQDLLTSSEQQAARDAIISLGPFLNWTDGAPDPSPQEASSIKEKIEVLQGQLLFVGALMEKLKDEYKQFLSAHSA